MTIFRYSAIQLAIPLLLIGCTNKISDEDLICDPSPGFIAAAGTQKNLTSGDQEALVSDCIHKWGYRFSRAPGSNSEIAKATIGRCRAAITDFFNLKIAEGQRTNFPFSASDSSSWKEKFDEEALTRVVEARAGKCSIRGADQK